MDIGSEVHSLLELYILGKGFSLEDQSDEVIKAYEAFRLWEKTVNLQVSKPEQIVWSKKHRFAGTLDVVGYLNGKLFVIDFKTSKGFYDEYLLQIAAYKEAYQEMTGEKVEGVGILRLDKFTGVPEWKEYNLAETNKAWAMFQCLCQYWHIKKEKTNERD